MYLPFPPFFSPHVPAFASKSTVTCYFLPLLSSLSLLSGKFQAITTVHFLPINSYLFYLLTGKFQAYNYDPFPSLNSSSFIFSQASFKPITTVHFLSLNSSLSLLSGKFQAITTIHFLPLTSLFFLFSQASSKPITTVQRGTMRNTDKRRRLTSPSTKFKFPWLCFGLVMIIWRLLW